MDELFDLVTNDYDNGDNNKRGGRKRGSSDDEGPLLFMSDNDDDDEEEDDGGYGGRYDDSIINHQRSSVTTTSSRTAIERKQQQQQQQQKQQLKKQKQTKKRTTDQSSSTSTSTTGKNSERYLGGLRILFNRRNMTSVQLEELISHSMVFSPASLAAMPNKQLATLVEDPSPSSSGGISGTTVPNFVTVGLIFKNSGTKMSRNGSASAFCILDVGSNFQSGPCMSVFLFGDAYTQYMKQCQPGQMIYLQAPKLLPPKQQQQSQNNINQNKNYTSADYGISFSVSKTSQLGMVGTAQDFGFCKATNVRTRQPDGRWLNNGFCRQWIDKRTSPSSQLCPHHCKLAMKNNNTKSSSSTTSSSSKLSKFQQLRQQPYQVQPMFQHHNLSRHPGVNNNNGGTTSSLSTQQRQHHNLQQQKQQIVSSKTTKNRFLQAVPSNSTTITGRGSTTSTTTTRTSNGPTVTDTTTNASVLRRNNNHNISNPYSKSNKYTSAVSNNSNNNNNNNSNRSSSSDNSKILSKTTRLNPASSSSSSNKRKHSNLQQHHQEQQPPKRKRQRDDDTAFLEQCIRGEKRTKKHSQSSSSSSLSKDAKRSAAAATRTGRAFVHDNPNAFDGSVVVPTPNKTIFGGSNKAAAAHVTPSSSSSAEAIIAQRRNEKRQNALNQQAEIAIMLKERQRNIDEENNDDEEEELEFFGRKPSKPSYKVNSSNKNTKMRTVSTKMMIAGQFQPRRNSNGSHPTATSTSTTSSFLEAMGGNPIDDVEMEQVRNTKSRFCNELKAEEYAKRRERLRELERLEASHDQREAAAANKNKHNGRGSTTDKPYITKSWLCVTCGRSFQYKPKSCFTSNHEISVRRDIIKSKSKSEKRLKLNQRSAMGGDGLQLGSGLEWSRNRFS